MNASDKTVFRHYTQAALELQYDSRARSPELHHEREAWESRVIPLAQAMRASAAAALDISYGPHPRQKIDLFFVENSDRPLMIFIHGGYWKQRHKDEFAWMASAFTDRDINFATIGYPLCPQVRIGDIVASVQLALRFLRDNAGRFGFDADRMHLAGHSAGAHLTAMMATADIATSEAAPELLKSITCVSGLYDLEPLQLVKVNDEIRLDQPTVDAFSPLRLCPRPGIAITLTVGAREAEEFVRNTTELDQAWRDCGRVVSLIRADDAHHFNVLDHFATPGRPLNERVMAVIESWG